MGRVVLQPTPKGKATGISSNVSRRRRRKLPSVNPTTTTALPQDSVATNAKSTNEDNRNYSKADEKQGGSPADLTIPSALGAMTTKHRTRQALAIDTRLLVPSDENTVEHEGKARALYKGLLEDLVCTGAIPSTISYAAITESSLVVETQDIGDPQQLQALTIQPVVFSVESTDLTDMPKQLLPKNSWKLVRGLVDSICKLDKEADNQVRLPPFDVTVVMRVSLLVGENLAHADGLEATVDHVSTYFQHSTVQSIQIFLAVSPDDDNDGSKQTLVDVLEAALQHKLQGKAKPPAVDQEKEGKTGLPVVFSIHKTEDNRAGYRKMIRRLVRQSLGGMIHGGQLRVHLPETDGLQCELLLDAEYNLLATSIQNQESWEQLSRDLQALCSSDPLQVQQLIPYSALDASLMFGVPLRLTASAHTQECQDYQTMQVLFSSLLRLLQERELVLLLQVPKTSRTDGVWFGRPEQTLVLIPRETSGSSVSPQSALLYGYATACQWLLEEQGFENFHPSLDEETKGQLQDYVDFSLEQVLCGPYNPLVRPVDLFDTLSSSQDDAGQDEVEKDEAMEK